MIPFDLREPVNAWSHGAGMMMALPITWFLLRQCSKVHPCGLERRCRTPDPCGPARGTCRLTRHQRFKFLSLLVFGASLTFCYAASAVFHAVPLRGAALSQFQRLDHVGIYLLIAGTYTPVVYSLLRRRWLWGTMATVWTIALVCAAWVWFEGILPIWLSTSVYLTMGWGSLFCYRELARTYSHRTLLPLPLGGLFYTVGALINLARWPVFMPGVFGSHELFHLFVIGGSAFHVYFMLNVVIPAPWPGLAPLPVRSRLRAPLLLRWTRAMLSRRVRQWMLHVLPHARWLDQLLAPDLLDPVPSESRAKVV